MHIFHLASFLRHLFTMSILHSVCLLLLVASAVVVTCFKDDASPQSQILELTKRDKYSKGFGSDYNHFRIGRSDPGLVYVPPFDPTYYPGEKRAAYGDDYAHMRFGRRGPSFTDYGHLRFG